MRTFKPLDNLLRSTACAPALLEILDYPEVNFGFCAPLARNLLSLATVIQRFPWANVKLGERENS